MPTVTFAVFLLLPLVTSLAAFLVRDRRLLSSGLVLGALALEVNLLRLLPLDQRLDLGPLSFTIGQYQEVFVLLTIVATAFVVAFGHWVQPWPDFAWRAILVLACLIATILEDDWPVAIFFLQLTGLASLALVYRPLVEIDALSVFQKYLVLIVVSGFFLVLSSSLVEPFLLDRDNVVLAKVIVGLLTIGLGLRLAAIPFHYWFPDLAEHAPPMATALSFAGVNGAVLALMLRFSLSQPWLLEAADGRRLLLAGGLVAVIAGAILALGAGDLGRLVAYAAMQSAGFVLLGLSWLGQGGLAPAVLEVLVQTLAVLLVFMCAGMIGQRVGHARIARLGGLWGSLPASAVGLGAGMLTLLGIPPFAGFPGHWLLFALAARQDSRLPIAMGLGSTLLAVALGRAFLRTFSGESYEAKPSGEPLPPAVLILMLSGLLLLVGLFPEPLLAAIEGAFAPFLNAGAP